MPPRKGSIGKEITKGRESEAKALLGIHYQHLSLFKGIQASQARGPLTEYGEKIKGDLERAMSEAVKSGNVDFFKLMTALLEIAKEGPRSPIEYALITKRPLNLTITIEKNEVIKVERDPHTISKLRSVVESAEGTRPTGGGTTIKAAAKKLGIKLRRGRPQEIKTPNKKIKRRIKGK